MGRQANRWAGALVVWTLLVWALEPVRGASPAEKQRSLDEWRNLTSAAAEPPRVFVKGEQILFYFETGSGVEAFSANWHRVRAPASSYKVNSAILHWDQKLPRMPDGRRGWREAVVIAGAEWRRLATNLIAVLTPPIPGHGAYYQAFLSDGVLYRDAQGAARFAPLHEQPAEVVIEHRFTADETLDILARLVDEQLARSHPRGMLFLIMAPNASRVTQPLLLDRSLHRCACLTPAALYDTTDRGLSLADTAEGLSALFPESHGLALIKNPVSSAARLGDLGMATLVRFLRLPLPKGRGELKPLSRGSGMDLAAWDAWLDRHTGTRLEAGSTRLLIDGDQFFTRLSEGISGATNHIHFQVYIFDRDDIGCGIADQLKARSGQIDVKVILDRMGSVAGGIAPPGTPMPQDFVEPNSILTYLRKDSRVHARPFLNPWLSADHSKVLLIDGRRAWIGGMNLGREYRYEWHDLMVELEGPVVGTFEELFRRQWAYVGPLGDLGYAAAVLSGGAREMAPPRSGHWAMVRRLPTRTAWKPFAAAVLGSLRQARSYIYVENPYLFDKHVIAGLVHARRRGVDVRVVLPRVNDFKSGGRSNLVIANYLLQHGVRVYFYPGMTHVKALLIDDWACLGSGNLNHLSLRLNQEENIATSDAPFVADVRRNLFEQDFNRSFELVEPVSVEWMDFVADLVLENF